MKRISLTVFILLLVLLAGCGKKVDKTGTSSGGSTKVLPVGTLPEKKVQSADEVIKEAENAHYSSGDADDESLYTGFNLPNDGIGPAFIQSYTMDDFEVYPHDDEFFRPDTADYLIASFEENKTIIYSFDASGTCRSIRGRIVYKSSNDLLKANSDKNLQEGAFGEDGYTYKDNVLYYNMPEDGVFAASFYADKYDLMKTAANGGWNAYTYWFSKPYEDVYAYYDDTFYQEAIASMEYADFNGGTYDDWDTSGGITEAEAASLLRSIMTPGQSTFDEYSSFFSRYYSSSEIQAYYNISYRLPEEFEHTYFSIIMNESDFAYVVQYCYTVPSGYMPGDKLDSFVLSGALVKEDEKWVFGTGDDFNAYRNDIYSRILTSDAYNSYMNGCRLTKRWIPFPMNDAIVIDSVFYAQVTEIYYDYADNLCVTIYLSNDTDYTHTFSKIDRLVILGPNGETVVDVEADMNMVVMPHDILFAGIRIPTEYQNGLFHSDMSVGVFAFSVD